jgi:uncharacterized metal-binding protein YceD (DUF177 family)
VTPELSRPVAADRIGSGGFSYVVEADAAEREAVAGRLMIPAIEALRCGVTLRRGADASRGEIIAEGALRAAVVRTCVVSADDFPVTVEAAFRVLFVRAGTEREEVDVEADDEIPYENGMLDLGELATEQLALELDPYPRKPGVALPDAEAGATRSPFAALASRKPNN